MARGNNQNNILDEIFTDEWYADVINATNFAMEYQSKLGIDEITLAHQIIDYNINKRLEEKLVNNLVKLLPKNLNWEHSDILRAFDEFKSIIDSCNACPKFKTYTVKINVGKSALLLKEFILWKDLVNLDYPALHIEAIPMKTKNHYKLEIKRID